MVGLEGLLKISSPKTFPKGAYICHEGQSGNEMYVVLQGSVDIYINTLLDGEVRISHVDPGGFFGEMAMFDSMPRSASCVAHEPTVCIAIDRSNLQKFIIANPEITEKLISSLSGRVRMLDNRLFKSDVGRLQSKRGVMPSSNFKIPDEHKTAGKFVCNSIDSKFFDHLPATCPVCEKPIALPHLRENELHLTQTLPNQRPVYKEGDPVWHNIWSCIHCGYSNFHMNFFGIDNFPRAQILQIVNLQRQYRKTFDPKTQFDTAAFQYYQAIWFNHFFTDGATLLLGKMWQCLCWIYTDVNNVEMQRYCRERAVHYLRETIDLHQDQLINIDAKRKCLRMICSMLMEMGQIKLSQEYAAKLEELKKE